MFWGVTLESGKRYSQKVLESYHLSMACLEPIQGDTKPANKHVVVMLEHEESEYALCVLEYGRVMQFNLDLIFDCGEVVTYFLNGEGTVHLTGYALAETEEESEIADTTNDLSATNAVNEEEDEADEDWVPSKAENSEDSLEDSDESEDEDSETDSEPDEAVPEKEIEIDQNRLSEGNEEDGIDGAQGKRRKVGVQGNKSKKRKASDASPTENGNADNSDNVKSKKQIKMEVNHINADDSEDNLSGGESDVDNEDDDSSVDYSSEGGEQEISSVGRTPMPKKVVTSFTSLGESPELPCAQKKSSQKKEKTNIQNVSPATKGIVPVTPKNTRKIAGNVLVEELRTGSGPLAKKGKFVSLHYVARLANGKVFESCEAPKKPFFFRMGREEVLKGLDIGLEGLRVGGKRKITVPPNMGYGNKKLEGLPPNSTLIFTVELKSVR